jgi:lysyl-tRNA synthetase class 2
MNIIINEEIIKKYQGAKMGIFVIKGISVEKENAIIEELTKSVEEKIISEGIATNIDNVTEVQIWRKIYQSFGCSPKKVSSVESLLNDIQRTKRIPRINSIVNLYNSISAKYLLPMAAYDYDKVDGDIELRFSRKAEEFTPLGTNQIEKTSAGEVIYSDNKEVVCRRWNFMDCDKTKITLNTKNIVFFMDGAPEIETNKVEKALQELGKYISDIFNVKGQDYILFAEEGKNILFEEEE